MYQQTLPKAGAHNISNALRSTLVIGDDERVPFIDNACRLLMIERFGRGCLWSSFAELITPQDVERSDTKDDGGQRFVSRQAAINSENAAGCYFRPSAGYRLAGEVCLPESPGTQFQVPAASSNSAIRPPPHGVAAWAEADCGILIFDKFSGTQKRIVFPLARSCCKR